MRIDWQGFDAVTEETRRQTEQRIHKLGAHCGQMAGFEVSLRAGQASRPEEVRAACRCGERSRCLVAVRRGLPDALHAFENIAEWRCGGPV